jgi:membrane-bound lytic murein transglycosylase B
MHCEFALAVMVCIALLQTPWNSSARPQEEDDKSLMTESLSNQAFSNWLEDLRSEANRKGISEATLNAASGRTANYRGRSYIRGSDERLLGRGNGAYAIPSLHFH